MNAVTTRPTGARAAAVAQQEQAIAQSAERAVAAKRPTALNMMAQRLRVSEANLMHTLRNTVFRDANDAEFTALVVVSNEYELNPLTKEIYAFKNKGGGIVPVVGVDGWIRIMNRQPDYDGIEFTDIVDEKGELYAIEAVIYRKGLARPVRVTEYLDECRRQTDPWRQSPKRMLRHRALIQCVRVAFGISGLPDPDETEVLEAVAYAIDPTPMPMRHQVEQRREDPPHDPETGEILDNDDEDEERRIAEQLDSQTFNEAEGTAVDDVTDQQQVEDQSVKIVADLIDRCVHASTIASLNKIRADFEAAVPALDDAQYQQVKNEIAAAETRLKPRTAKE